VSNKRFDQLWEADQVIRSLSPNKGMTNGMEPQIRVTLMRGFELFSTRPHHNCETWSDGYIVEAFDGDGKLIEIATAEDLDDALIKLANRMDVKL
jgi:hypothetical protein